MIELTISHIFCLVVGLSVGVFMGAVAMYLDMIRPSEEEAEKIRWKNS